jgi:hypothetical protein
MGVEVVTKEDLQVFRLLLLDDLKRLFAKEPNKEEKTEWLKSREVRKLLKVSPGTLQNLRVAGKLHPKKIGGSWYYSLKELNTLFEDGK